MKINELQTRSYIPNKSPSPIGNSMSKIASIKPSKTSTRPPKRPPSTSPYDRAGLGRSHQSRQRAAGQFILRRSEIAAKVEGMHESLMSASTARRTSATPSNNSANELYRRGIKASGDIVTQVLVDKTMKPFRTPSPSAVS